MSVVRVAVMGGDASALALSVFLKHRGGSRFDITHVMDQSTVRYNSSWLRNDRKGRQIVFGLFRDILNFGESEICVSNNNVKLAILNRKVQTVPSFRLVVKYLWSFSLEPFRTRSDPGSSLREFLLSRFGPKFANNYSDVISRLLCGSRMDVSAQAIFPNLFKNKSILLGPLCDFFEDKKNSKKIYADFTNRLYQTLVTGGKFISVLGGLNNLNEVLINWLKLNNVKIVQKNFFKQANFDLVVSSESPETVWREFETDVLPDWMHLLMHRSEVVTTRIPLAANTAASSAAIVYNGDADSPLIGAVDFGALFGFPYVDVYSEKGDVEVQKFVSTCFPNMHVSSPSTSWITTCAVPVLGFEEAMSKFHKHRRTMLRGRLLVLGPWRNLTDSLDEASELADEVIDRFANWPKFVENELPKNTSTRIV